MITFKDYVTFFEAKAVSHTDIAHDPSGKKSFFNVDMVELIAGLKSKVNVDKYNLILVNYNSILNEGNVPGEKEIMFFIMKKQKKGDVVANVDIRTEAELIAQDIIAKIKEEVTTLPRDQHLNEMFRGSMDRISDVHVIHTELNAAAEKLIGVQVSFTNKFNYCPEVRAGKFV